MFIVLKRQVELEEDIVTFRLVGRICGSTEFQHAQQAIKLIQHRFSLIVTPE
ncbi:MULTISPECIES: hypothetical protein [Kamptonema]|uniref:hypothetical protein n=1 Tax=Kamptonema TaxID=1501433 RepID=UPI0003111951|nr:MULTISPECIES: hypothetical protein [Kamptonema]